MEKEKTIATYMRVGHYEQLEKPIEHIIERAKRGEIKTLVVSELERFCDDPERRETLINELAAYEVEILPVLDETKKPRCCAIYNRHSVNDPERLTEMRDKLLTYCKETLGISDYILFEEVGSCLEKRAVFDDMVTRIENGVFTDLLVNHIDRIFKPAYDVARFIELIERIQSKAVLHILN